MSNEFPIIPASEPTVIATPPVPAASVTYDRWWLSRLTINADDPNGAARAAFKLVKGRKLSDGTWELSPREDDVRTLAIADLFAAAQGDPMLAEVVGGVLQAVVSIGTAREVL